MPSTNLVSGCSGLVKIPDQISALFKTQASMPWDTRDAEPRIKTEAIDDEQVRASRSRAGGEDGQGQQERQAALSWDCHDALSALLVPTMTAAPAMPPGCWPTPMGLAVARRSV